MYAPYGIFKTPTKLFLPSSDVYDGIQANYMREVVLYPILFDSCNERRSHTTADSKTHHARGAKLLAGFCLAV